MAKPTPLPMLRCPEFVEVRPTNQIWRWRIDLHDGSCGYPRTRFLWGGEARAERVARRMWARHLARKTREATIEAGRRIVAGDAA